MLRSENFKSCTAQLPCLRPVLFHCSDDILLFDIVGLAKALGKTVDVEHDEVGQQGYDDDNISKRSRAKFVVDAPE